MTSSNTTPHLWRRNADQRIVRIDSMPAEVDEHYIVEIGVVGDIAAGLRGIAHQIPTREGNWAGSLRRAIDAEYRQYAEDLGFPVKPQKILWDLRQVLEADDILISDVGAHEMWIARLWQAKAANTCVISNGFAAIGIGVPGAIAAKLVFPERRIVTITGDDGFLMNSQEIEIALRLGLALVILVWSDSRYGLIKWLQDRRFSRDSHIDFTNPDFVQYAENMKLTEKSERWYVRSDRQPACQPDPCRRCLSVANSFGGREEARVERVDSLDVESALGVADILHRDHRQWLAAHEWITVLRRTAEHMTGRLEVLARTAAAEGGKPLRDSRIEVMGAIDGVRNCAELARNHAGHEIPMGATAASEGRLTFTTNESHGRCACMLSSSAARAATCLPWGVCKLCSATRISTPPALRPMI